MPSGAHSPSFELLSFYYRLPLAFGPIVWIDRLIGGNCFFWIMAANRESSVEESSEWAGISESGDDDMDFEVWFPI